MSNRIGVANELRIVLGRHRGRSDSTLRIAISVSESLKKIFDDYVRKELDDLRLQIGLLQQVDRDMQKEEDKLNDLERRFEETNSRLDMILNVAREGKIKSLSWEGTFREESLLRLPPLPRTAVTEKSQKPVENLEIDTIVDGFNQN